MKSAYRVLAFLIALGVVIQAGAIAFAWFDVLADVDAGGVFDEDTWNAGHIAHGIIGMAVMPLLSLIFLIVSFFAKVPGGVKWAAITFGLVVLQVALALVGFGAAAVGALHGVNALVLFVVAMMAGERARRDVSASARSTTSEREMV